MGLFELGIAMKILAIQLNRPGDAILTTPALRWWMHAGHEVQVLLLPISAQLLDTMPGLAGIYPVPRQTVQIARDFRRWKKLSGMGFDWTVVFSHSSERPSLWAYLSGAPKRTAVALKKFPHLLRQTGWITQWLQHPSWAQHTVEQHLALAGVRASEASSYDLEYHPLPKAQQRHHEWLKQNGLARGEYIHFHLTSRLREKCWPVEHARRFIQLSQQLSLPLVVTNGPDFWEIDYASEVLQKSPKYVKALTVITPHQLGAVIEGAKAFIGMDSMPMHLAAALKIPGIVLFGPTNPGLWGPWHSRIHVIQSDPLFSDMTSISSSAVFYALQERLERDALKQQSQRDLTNDSVQTK